MLDRGSTGEGGTQPGDVIMRIGAVDDAQRAVAGDSAAMARLWQQHRRWVAAILLAHKPRWADLDDLLQDVAMSVVRKMGEIRDPGAIRPWLRTVAMNVAHAAARTGRRRAGEAAIDSEQLSAPTAEAPAVDAESSQRLAELAFQLPDGYREPLLLKAVQGLSYREIGQILGLPETTIETRIARARRQLRDLARQHLGGENC